MHRAGYVLVGGRSSRMGRDKALLPFRGRTLAECVARNVATAAGSVRLVGDPSKYGFLGFPVIEDRVPGCGPLSGIEAALADSTAEQTLIVACDMPSLNPRFLDWILSEAEKSTADVTWVENEPLCAVYRKSARAAAAAALAAGRYKVSLAFASLNVKCLTATDNSPLANANTPEDWASLGD
ncbi:MAG: molybdenum cofactor guanylyltransferase [Bryobacterales bacterium]|nr:molybdenum cofactor guanylyltransferase [Bryobacterales bacterium]